MVAANKEGVRMFVYALCEPDGKTIRYVGLTANLWKRMHWHYNHPTVPRVREWVCNLRSRGLVPCMTVIREVCGIENGLAVEAEEISKHRNLLGEQLLNDTGTGRKRDRIRRGLIEFGGRRMTIAGWAKELGISRQALCLRMQIHSTDVALSRGKLQATRLEEGIRFTPEYDPGTEDVFLPPDIVAAKTGLSHKARLARRKAMAEMLCRGSLESEVASHFGVTVATVKGARNEFLGTSAMRDRFERLMNRNRKIASCS